MMGEIEFSGGVRSTDAPDNNNIPAAMLISIHSLFLSTRTINVINTFFSPGSSVHWEGDRGDILRNVAARTPSDILLGDIVCFTNAEYLRMPSFGRKSLEELKSALQSHGLSLGMHSEVQAILNNDSAITMKSPDSTIQTDLNPALFLRISDFDLSVRTQNGLHNLFSHLNDPNQNEYKVQIYNMILNRSTTRGILLGDIVKFSESEFTTTPNFGRKSLEELKTVLAKYNLCLGMETFVWSNELIDVFFNKKGMALKQSQAALAQVQFNKSLPDEPVYLESEITALLAFVKLTSERNANIFKQRTGLDGKGGVTLEAIGRVYGITRERIRQIEKKQRAKFKHKLFLQLNTFNKIREYLGGIDIKQTETIEAELIAMGLTRGKFDLNGIFALEELINPGSDFFANCEVDRFPGTPQWFFFQGDWKYLAHKILFEINRISSGQGFVKLSDFNVILANLTDAPLNTDKIGILLEAIGDKHFLNKERTSFFIVGKRNRLANAILKCLYINRPLKPARIKDGLRRHTRLNRIPHIAELLEFCLYHPYFAVVNGKIDTHINLAPDEIISESELFLVDAFNDGSVVLTFEELKKRCLRAGMNPVTFYLYTKNIPILESDGNGRFALRGSQGDPFNLDMATATFTDDNSIKLLHGVNEGHTDDGHYWITFKLNEEIIVSGAFIPPLKLKDRIQLPHNIESYNGHFYGKTILLNQGICGFRMPFEDKGAEPGDTAILVHNALQNKIIIEIGSDDQIERAKLSGLFERDDDDMLEL